ncbi:MAG: antitoxin Xre-like helix-turn-helix domain-containing protein [Pseudomonadota bacterium]|nr:antitoxin Xre-like helix-turn-helix domain-containing protein [Pseudomonadota bacterium]
MKVNEQTQPEKGSVLLKALLNASDEIGLNSSELSDALGVEHSTFSEMKTKGSIDLDSKEGERALYIIDIARKLSILTSGDKDWMRAFMHSDNKGTGGIPAKQIATLDGIVKIVRYLDGMGGKR